MVQRSLQSHHVHPLSNNRWRAMAQTISTVNDDSQNAGVRVLVVDDQALMRDGLASLLSLEHGIAVAGTASNGEEAVQQVVALAPDVILMDVRMPVLDGVAATVQIRRDFPNTPILMLTTFDDDALVLAALQAGANGYLLKIAAQRLGHALRQALREA